MSCEALPSIMKFTMIRHSTEPWTVSLDNEWEEQDSTRGVMEIQLSSLRCTYVMLEWWIYKRTRSYDANHKIMLSTCRHEWEWKTPDCIIFCSSSCSSATPHIDLSAVMYIWGNSRNVIRKINYFLSLLPRHERSLLGWVDECNFRENDVFMLLSVTSLDAYNFMIRRIN